MRRAALALTACLLTAGLASISLAQQGAQRTAPDHVKRSSATLHKSGERFGTGTITFDNNVPFQRDGQDDGLIGNRFNPAGTHSINSVSFKVAGNYIAAGTVGSVVMTVWNVDSVAGNATVLQRQVVNGVPGIVFGGSGVITDATVQVPLAAPVLSHSGSFIAGVRNTFYDGCGGNTNLNSSCDGVALTEGAADPGSGFNAARLLFTGPFNPTSVVTVNSVGAAIPGQNAIFRVSGDNLPVELMQFDVD